MIYLEPRHWSIIQRILADYPYQFYVFGSRVKGTHRPFSDLDLCYKDALPDHLLAKIEGAFEESDLPFKIELVYYEHMSPEFRKLIEKDLVLLPINSRSTKG